MGRRRITRKSRVSAEFDDGRQDRLGRRAVVRGLRCRRRSRRQPRLLAAIAGNASQGLRGDVRRRRARRSASLEPRAADPAQERRRVDHDVDGRLSAASVVGAQVRQGLAVVTSAAAETATATTAQDASPSRGWRNGISTNEEVSTTNLTHHGLSDQTSKSARISIRHEFSGELIGHCQSCQATPTKEVILFVD